MVLQVVCGIDFACLSVASWLLLRMLSIAFCFEVGFLGVIVWYFGVWCGYRGVVLDDSGRARIWVDLVTCDLVCWV